MNDLMKNGRTKCASAVLHWSHSLIKNAFNQFHCVVTFSTFGVGKVLRQFHCLASQPFGFSPLCEAILSIHLKLWCEQSTSAISLPRLATLRVLAPLRSNTFHTPKTLVRAKYFACARLATLRVLAPLRSNTFHTPKTLVRAKGLEPSTSTLARLRSSQLSYARTAWGILT